LCGNPRERNYLKNIQDSGAIHKASSFHSAPVLEMKYLRGPPRQFLPATGKMCAVETVLKAVNSIVISESRDGTGDALGKGRRSGAASGQSGKDFGQRSFLIALLPFLSALTLARSAALVPSR
jgi:hypothetical protein